MDPESDFPRNYEEHFDVPEQSSTYMMNYYHRLMLDSRFNPELRILGGKELNIIRHENILMGKNKMSYEDWNTRKEELLDNLRHSIANFFGKPGYADVLDTFFRVASERVPEFETEYKAVAGNTGESSADIITAPGVINDKTFEMMIQEYQRYIETHMKEFDGKKETYREEFKEKLKRFIEQRWISADTEDVMRQVDFAQIFAVDPLSPAFTNARGFSRVLGVHASDVGLTGISVGQDPEYQNHERETTFHELLHAASGKDFKAVRIVRDGKEERIDLRVLRLGVSGIDQMNQEYPDPFNWLNEAITENITQELVGKETYSYPHERRLFQLLRTKGNSPLTENTFYNAYFESGDSFSDREHSHYHTMVKLIDSVYKPGFFRSLAKYMEHQTRLAAQAGHTNSRESAVLETIQAMETDWNQIMTLSE